MQHNTFGGCEAAWDWSSQEVNGMQFNGVIPAVVTPFRDKDLSIDESALDAHIRYLTDAGIETLVTTGTMGEAGSLTPEERREVGRLVIAASKGRASVVSGISSETARQSCVYAEWAAEDGAEGLMCLPPVTYQADDQELLAFFSEIARATDLPLIVYNNPGASKNDLQPETVAQLFDIGKVVAVKECSGDARRIPAIIGLTGGAMQVVVGGDDWALEGFSGGGIGWIAGCANVAPSECIELYRACEAGDLDAARDVYQRLLPLARFDMTPKLVQYFKAALQRLGHQVGPTRPPRAPLSQKELAMVDEALGMLRMKVAAGGG
jgi:4-hydroxy-tetrahydrodipicolinate synthase